MAVPRLHGVGRKQGNLGSRSRPETCNTKWFRQSDLARRKQSSLKNHGYGLGQPRGWGNHIYALARKQTTDIHKTNTTNTSPS